jgi:hypothetical protein
MNQQFTIQMNEEHIKYASRKFFFRHFRKSILLLTLLAALVFIFFIFGQQFNWLMVGALVFLVSFLFMLYVRLTGKRLSLFRKYGGTINYEFSEDFFKSKSGWASLEMKWETFKAVWIYPKVWMLWSGEAGYFTFPVDQISNDIKEFLKQKIVSVGGKVK